MAPSLTSWIAVFISTTVLITSCQDSYLQSSFFTYKPGNDNNEKCHVKIERDGIALINKGITIMYKDIKFDRGYYVTVEHFYKKMIADKDALNKIITNLRRVFSEDDLLLKDGREKFKISDTYESTAEQTQSLLIYLYTTDSKNSLYSYLNKVLRDHSENCNSKTISAREEYLAPYAAALTATLLHWKNLKSTKTTTYRGIRITICETNDPIIWLSFTSSSISENEAADFGRVTTYTITNNAVHNKWRPKLISEYSAKPEQQEALYHPGSVFKFNNVVHIGTKVAYDIALATPAYQVINYEYCPSN
ncbi:uncharacterized protein LOC127714172 [Mytilus californianus]|uniref:uncharacterized protein LOC127714172 n=1 Tax=Mytilus californianus TaxID=6549 RepID=UPI002245BB0D|nr:uncharacterized protein LOC127714172 [Mytilus californianus]